MLKLYKRKDSNYGRGVYFVDTAGKEDSSLFRLPVRRGVVVGVVEDHGPSGVVHSVRVRRRHSSRETVVPVGHAWGNFSAYMTEALDWLRQRRMGLSRRLGGFNHTSCWDPEDYDNIVYLRDRVACYVKADMGEIEKLARQLYEIETLAQADQARLCYRLQTYSNRLAGWSREIQRLLEKGRLPSKPAVEYELGQVEKRIELYSRKLTRAAGRKIRNVGPRKP